MKVQDLMNRIVRTCTEGDSLEQAATAMWEYDVGCLVVVDGERRPIGVITDRDALMGAFTQGVSLRDGRVRTAMSRTVHTSTPDSSLDQLEGLMQSAQIRRVPVVDGEGRLVGIITLGDLAEYSQWTVNHHFGVQGLAKTLFEVSKPRSKREPAALQGLELRELPSAREMLERVGKETIHADSQRIL
jgi:CBS domain-containing protein